MEFKAQTQFLQSLVDEKLSELSMRVGSVRAILEGSVCFTATDAEHISTLTSFMDGNFNYEFDNILPIRYYSGIAARIKLSDDYAKPTHYTYFWGIMRLCGAFDIAKQIVDILNAKKMTRS